DFIGPVSKQESFFRHPKVHGKCLPQVIAAALGVKVQRGQFSTDCFYGLWRGTVRVFVAGQLDDFGEAVLALDFLDGLCGRVWLDMDKFGAKGILHSWSGLLSLVVVGLPAVVRGVRRVSGRQRA